MSSRVVRLWVALVMPYQYVRRRGPRFSLGGASVVKRPVQDNICLRRQQQLMSLVASDYLSECYVTLGTPIRAETLNSIN